MLLTISRLVPAIRVLLVLTFAAIVVLQVMTVPGTLAYNAARDDNPFWHYPLLAVLEAELVFCQVILVGVWQLLGMVHRDRIFSTDSFRWVDLIIGAVTAGWLVWAGLGAFIALTSDDPGLPMVMAISLLAGAVVGLLVLVLRALLRQAATLRTDLETVI
jgi:hypothetical protein